MNTAVGTPLAYAAIGLGVLLAVIVLIRNLRRASGREMTMWGVLSLLPLHLGISGAMLCDLAALNEHARLGAAFTNEDAIAWSTSGGICFLAGAAATTPAFLVAVLGMTRKPKRRRAES